MLPHAEKGRNDHRENPPHFIKLKRLILEDKENSGAWSALGTMLYNGDCAGYTLPSEESFQSDANWFQIESFQLKRHNRTISGGDFQEIIPF